MPTVNANVPPVHTFTVHTFGNRNKPYTHIHRTVPTCFFWKQTVHSGYIHLHGGYPFTVHAFSLHTVPCVVNLVITPKRTSDWIGLEPQGIFKPPSMGFPPIQSA